MSGLLIRPVTSADFEQWLPLWHGYNRFYGRPEFPREITLMTWSRFFDAYEPVHGLVAEKDGILVGLVAMKLYDKVAEPSGFVVYRKQL